MIHVFRVIVIGPRSHIFFPKSLMSDLKPQFIREIISQILIIFYIPAGIFIDSVVHFLSFRPSEYANGLVYVSVRILPVVEKKWYFFFLRPQNHTGFSKSWPQKPV